MERNIFRVIGLLVVFLFVTFFSIKVEAASFKYSDFDWDEFASKNKNFWISSCETSKDENCVDRVLATKKKFYTQLYKLLAKVQNKYPDQKIIDDNIIIATVFYGLDSDSFRDPTDGEDNPYNLDSNDDDSTYLGEVDESAQEYFKNETNSLKTLINAFIGYKTTCYGYTDEVPSTSDNGKYCESGNIYYQKDDKCVVEVSKDLKSNFLDKLVLNFDSDSAKNRCSSLAKEKGYNDSDIIVNSDKEVNEEFYWDFLENTNSLDNKSHLQDYYISVLAKTDYKTMKELETDNDAYEKYNEEIKVVRRRIIKGIKEVLENYKGISDDYNNVNYNGYLWPIGSVEVSEYNGKKTALLDPETTTITSKFGLRVHPISGQNSNHNGVDLSGSKGTTNVIAVKNGIIFRVVSGCVEGDLKCGGGFGNYVMIEHQDGNYTIYAHLYEDSITVKEGDSVIDGEVIAKVGSTGNSTGPHLHFEVRVGGQDSSSVQDPLNYINPNYPRTTSFGSGDIVIPDEYGNSGFFTYTKIITNWVYNQKKVYDKWISSGSNSDRNVATIDGRYLIACTSTFGKVGDKIDFFLGDGTKIETIMMDEKSQSVVSWDTNPANKWGHNNGQQVLEFEILSPINSTGNVGSWMGWAGKRVASATNLGENIIEN